MGNRVGEQLGNYRLIRLLGTGSIADVYLGEHLYLGSQAAIKVLHTALTNKEVEGFLAEARHLVGLTHPHIIRILDFAVEGNMPFLVMEYAPSSSLRTLYTKGARMPLEQVVAYVKQVADGLQYIHNQKLVHRDVKPENLLLVSDNEVVLSDLGMAALAQVTDSVILRGLIGTPTYIAPEQIRGRPGPASDQYALGIVVYEWLCGRPPFQGTDQALIHQHLHVSPPSLCKQVPTISPALEEVVLVALAKDPARRFANIQAFATALKQATLSIEEVDTARLSPKTVPSSKIEAPSYPAQIQFTTPGPSTPSQDQPPPVPLTLAPSEQIRPSSTASHDPSTANAVYPLHDERGPISRRRPLRGRSFFLLLGLVLLLLGSSISFFAIAHYKIGPPGPSLTTKPTTMTATPNIAATATFLAATPNPYPPHKGTLVLYDPLSNDNHGYKWPQYSNPSVGDACTFIGGAYHVIMPPNYGGPCFAQATDFSNFVFEVQMTFVKTAPNWSGGGLAFRGNGNNYYYLEIFESGRYTFDGCAGNNCTLQLASGLGPQQAIQAFHSGLKQPNLVAVVATGNTFDVYVNGQLVVGPVNDNSYSHGSIGVYGEGGFDVNNPNNKVTETEVVYSNAKVWQL